jgi:hypothetical protein
MGVVGPLPAVFEALESGLGCCVVDNDHIAQVSVKAPKYL